ncbi:GntR family transcriptional regulator [Lactobacillus xylocopicola]|uniref:HTH-type transcriptional regulator YurK n=1 Tax=Lactobacillus xylocopicola TaxID=2976676 RepID=A0ABM8BFX9_9LACO|nr:GntR family transcriptional regulator [Lactobacillus xylocopicola]BDR60160.1 putative HTH-type transcriptional regulator YurK [Lactobacillus xylocopicola]
MNSDKTIAAVPLYRKVYLDLKRQIQQGQLKPEQKLPSEQYLCEKYQVSRITVRRALKLLTEERLIATIQGKGSYVNAQKMSGKLEQIQGFSEFALSRAKTNKQLIIKREILQNADVAKVLLLPEQADLIYIKRLSEIAGTPMAIDEAWLSAERFPDLLVNINTATSLYEYLEEKYHESPASSYREIGTILPNAKQTHLLKLTTTVPLFEVNKTVYNQFEQPLEFSHYVVRGDEMTYTIDSTSDSHIYFNNKKMS